MSGWGAGLPSLGGASGGVGHTQGAVGSLWALSWCRRCHRCPWCPGAGMPRVWWVLGEWRVPWVPKMPVVEGVAPGSHKADWMGGGSGRVRIFESGVVSCIRLVSHRNSQASMRVDTSGLGGWSVWGPTFFMAGKGFTLVVGAPPWVYSSSGFLSSGSGPTPCPEASHCHLSILFTTWQQWLLLTHLDPWMLPKTE